MSWLALGSSSTEPMSLSSCQRRPRAALSAFALLVGSCSLQSEESSWSEQLAPAGVCWEVNLSNGVTDTRELRDAYRCLNQSGSLDPLRPVVDAMDLPARDGQTNWAHVLGLLASSPAEGVDLPALVGSAGDLLAADPELAGDALDAGVELLYATPVSSLERSRLADPERLASGIFVPLVDPLQAVAAATLADGPDVPELLVAALRSASLKNALCTLVGVARSADPSIGPLAGTVMASLGDAIDASRTPGNDRWRRASGDSLRDLVDSLLYATDTNGQRWDHAAAPALSTLLGDTPLQSRLEDTLLRLAEDGNVQPLFEQMRVLVEIDASGASLDAPPPAGLPGERVSALSSFLRLIDRGQGSISCLGFDLDNLSSTLLRFLAARNPETVELGVSLLGSFLDSWLGGVGLDVVEFVCDGVDEELIWDLESVDRFNDEETADLLVILLRVLSAAAPDRGDDRIDELVDVLALAWRAELAPPVEEVLRDLGDRALAESVASLIPVVVDPAPLRVDECPTGSTPLDFAELWTVVETVLVGREGERAAAEVLRPSVLPLLESDQTWSVLGNLAPLLQDDSAVLRDLPDLGARLLAADPDATVLEETAVLLEDPKLQAALLQLAASPSLGEALTSTRTDAPGPLPFAAALHLDGTLDRTLDTLLLVLQWMEGLVDAGN